MDKRMKRAMVMALAVLSVTLGMGTAMASGQCRCCSDPKAGTASERWDAVFVGVVTEVELEWNVANWAATQVRNFFRTDGGHSIAPKSKVRATLSVLEVIKGSDRRVRTVSSYPAGGWCGLEFEVGKTYLVYGSNRNLGLWTGKCSASREVGDEEIDTIKRAVRSNGTAI
jgi:hypothetical protein